MSFRSAEAYRRKAVAVAAAFAVIGSLEFAPTARAQGTRGVKTLFTQQDAVQAFDLSTGEGYQVGTATGEISGTTFVQFQFAPS
jgi:hypothetical protein